MTTDNLKRLQTLAGVSLLLIVVLGFLLMIVLGLPRESAVSQEAKPLNNMPRDLFTTNAATTKIKSLNIPANLPVVVKPDELGRSNVFSQY